MHHIQNLICRKRLAEVEALHLFTTDITKESILFLSLNSFCQSTYSDVLRHLNNRGDKGYNVLHFRKY